MPSFSKNPGSIKSNHLFKVSLSKNTMLALRLISRTIDQPLTVDSQVKKHYFCTYRDPSKLIENFFDLPKNYLPKTKLMLFVHTCTCTQSVELIMPPRSRFTLKPDSDRGATRHDEDFDILGGRSWENSPGLIHFYLCFYTKNTTGD